MSAPSLTVYVQGQGSVSADGLNTFGSTCDTIAELRAFIGLPGVQVCVRGFTSPGDGGQGDFYWDASSGGTDDGLNIIVPSGAGTGAWLRLPQSPVGSGLVLPPFSGSISINALQSNAFEIIASTGSSFTVNAPVAAFDPGQTLVVMVKNTSGGALGGLTWASGYKLGASWTQPASAHSRSISFMFDGTNWIELFRSAADVSN